MIAIISDTHMPRGERRLTEACTAVIARSDLIIHAGDFTERSVLEQLETYAPVVAVHGNVDEPALRRLLPETTTVDVGASRIAVVHDGGPARGRIERLRNRFPHADAVIFGHSHLPLHERAGDGFQIFNPGSPTERRRAPNRTIGIARCGDAGLGLELVVVG